MPKELFRQVEAGISLCCEVVGLESTIRLVILRLVKRRGVKENKSGE